HYRNPYRDSARDEDRSRREPRRSRFALGRFQRLRLRQTGAAAAADPTLAERDPGASQTVRTILVAWIPRHALATFPRLAGPHPRSLWPRALRSGVSRTERRQSFRAKRDDRIDPNRAAKASGGGAPRAVEMSRG